jgi:hypothetical protein
MGNTDDADRPAILDTTYAVARAVPASPRPERVPTTAAPSLAMRPRSVGPHRPRPGLGEYLIVARRRP